VLCNASLISCFFDQLTEDVNCSLTRIRAVSVTEEAGLELVQILGGIPLIEIGKAHVAGAKFIDKPGMIGGDCLVRIGGSGQQRRSVMVERVCPGPSLPSSRRSVSGANLGRGRIVESLVLLWRLWSWVAGSLLTELSRLRSLDDGDGGLEGGREGGRPWNQWRTFGDVSRMEPFRVRWSRDKGSVGVCFGAIEEPAREGPEDMLLLYRVVEEMGLSLLHVQQLAWGESLVSRRAGG
jgi:hypothetical protein